MTIGAVYRAWVHDIVSTPNYASTTSATSRTDRVPVNNPDQQPPDKRINDTGIDRKQHIDDHIDRFDLGGWKFNVPLVTNYAQSIMVAQMLKTGEKNMNKEGGSVTFRSRPNNPVTEAHTKVHRVDATADYDNAAQFERDTMSNADNGRYSSVSSEGGGGGATRAIGNAASKATNDFLLNQILHSNKRGMYIDSHPEHNINTAPDPWNTKEYTSLTLDFSDIGSTQKDPRIKFGMNIHQAIQNLELHNLSSRLMAEKKIQEGRDNLLLEPRDINLSSPAQDKAKDMLEDTSREARGRLFDFQAGITSYVQMQNERSDKRVEAALEKVETECSDSDMLSERAETATLGVSNRPEYFGPSAVQIHMDLLSGVHNKAEQYASYGVDTAQEDKKSGFTLQQPDPRLGFKRDMAGLGLQVNSINVDGHIDLNSNISGIERDIIIARRDSVANYKRSLPVGRIRPATETETAGAVAGSTFLVQMNPVLTTLENRETYIQHYPAELNRLETNNHTYDLSPLLLPHKDRTISRQEYEINMERQPFTDELEIDRVYNNPYIPPDLMVVTVRSDQPFDYSNFFQKFRRFVPDMPIDVKFELLRDQEVNNVAKDPENIRTEKIEENQLYGRDNPTIQEVIRLKEIKELDHFEKEIQYLEGQHTPTVDKDRKDRMPENIFSLTVDNLVWGWNRKA